MALTKKWWQEEWPRSIEWQLWHSEWYRREVGPYPEEFPENSEGHLQWTYNPRTKVSQEYAKKIFKNIPVRKKQKKTRRSQKGRKNPTK